MLWGLCWMATEVLGHPGGSQWEKTEAAGEMRGAWLGSQGRQGG